MREGVCHLLELQVLQQPEFAVAFSQVRARTRCTWCYFGKTTDNLRIKVCSPLPWLLSLSSALSWMFCLKRRSSTGEGLKSTSTSVANLRKVSFWVSPHLPIACPHVGQLDRVWETVLSSGLNSKSSWPPSSAACHRSTEVRKKKTENTC